jgi:hypothetical protein
VPQCYALAYKINSCLYIIRRTPFAKKVFTSNGSDLLFRSTASIGYIGLDHACSFNLHYKKRYGLRDHDKGENKRREPPVNKNRCYHRTDEVCQSLNAKLQHMNSVPRLNAQHGVMMRIVISKTVEVAQRVPVPAFRARDSAK